MNKKIIIEIVRSAHDIMVFDDTVCLCCDMKLHIEHGSYGVKIV